MAKKRYTKVEEEILQILEEADREPAWRRVQRRRPRVPRRPKLRRWSRFDPGGWAWFGASFGLALLAILVADWSQMLAWLLAIASILVFLSPIVLALRGNRPDPTMQRWRGRDIEFPPSRTGVLGELRYRLWRLRRRR